MKYIKRTLSVLLAACLLATTCFAAEAAPAAQPISPWAYESLTDIYALGMWSDDYYSCILDPVTEEQLTKITDVVAAKLALLNLEKHQGPTDPLVLDGTRGAVMTALYREAAEYNLPGIEMGAAAWLSAHGVLRGEPAASRICTLQEALVMAQRLILAVYDSQDAGSKGLLWKAVNGENTLYLLGTIHVDRGNVYPFHKSLRDAIASSQTTIFEVDFGNTDDINSFAAMQFYSDGTTLKDHVSDEVYRHAVEAGTTLGLTEAQTASFKPWALANQLQAVSLSGGSDPASGSSGAAAPMVLDSYLDSITQNLGHTVEAVETATFQGTLFDGLSAEYQEAYLAGMLAAYYGEPSGETESESAPAADPAAGIDRMLEAWKARDFAGFDAQYDKEAVLTSGDELSVALFVERDPGMLAYAEAFLNRDGANTGLMAVGAGHMVGSTGVVQGLIDKGYTVEPAA